MSERSPFGLQPVLDGVSEDDRDRLFETLSSMKINLLGKLAAAGERKASHG